MSIFSQDKKDFSKYKIYGRKPFGGGGGVVRNNQCVCTKNRTALKFNKHYKQNFLKNDKHEKCFI